MSIDRDLYDVWPNKWTPAYRGSNRPGDWVFEGEGITLNIHNDYGRWHWSLAAKGADRFRWGVSMTASDAVESLRVALRQHAATIADLAT